METSTPTVKLRKITPAMYDADDTLPFPSQYGGTYEVYADGVCIGVVARDQATAGYWGAWKYHAWGFGTGYTDSRTNAVHGVINRWKKTRQA